MSDIKLTVVPELHYWKVHKNKKYRRADIMRNMFPNLQKHKVVADIGCGPLCGIFHKLKFPKMFAVDPLWDEYKENNLMRVPKNVSIVKAEAQSFVLDEPADLIVSFNALDHSGNLKNSITNIMKNLLSDGRFCFHIHMRTKEQLNKGHQMLLTEKLVDNILDKYITISKKICKDPLDYAGKYMAYIAEIRYE